MRIYTKKGDGGTTSLFRGGRVPKDNLRVAAYGDVDELNAAIGVAAAVDPIEFRQELLEQIQRDLFTIGSILATADYDEKAPKSGKMVFDQTRVAVLEDAIDTATSETPPLENFIIPGGSQKSALLHTARTVCRRAERSLVTLSSQEPVPQPIMPYLNRLSDLLFTLARLANVGAGIPDREW